MLKGLAFGFLIEGVIPFQLHLEQETRPFVLLGLVSCQQYSFSDKLLGSERNGTRANSVLLLMAKA